MVIYINFQMILDPSFHQVLDPCLNTPERKREILCNDEVKTSTARTAHIPFKIDHTLFVTFSIMGDWGEM